MPEEEEESKMAKETWLAFTFFTRKNQSSDGLLHFEENDQEECWNSLLQRDESTTEWGKIVSAPAQGQVSAVLTAVRLLQKDKLHPLLPHFLPLLLSPPHYGLTHSKDFVCQSLSLDLPCLQKLQGEFLAISSYLEISIVSAGLSRPTGCFPVLSSFVVVEGPFSGGAHVLTAPIPYSCHGHGGPNRSS